MEEYLLGSLIEENKTLDLWLANLKFFGGHLKFKIDTGVDNTVIIDKAYENLWNRQPLRPVQGRFKSPIDTLSYEGKFQTSSSPKRKKCKK